MSDIPASVSERITRQVVLVIGRRRPGQVVTAETIAPDTDLREVGLDSLGLVNLMLAVEAEFDVFIPQEDMIPQNFRTVAAIAAVISGLSIAA